jgi:hypothetical protein
LCASSIGAEVVVPENYNRELFIDGPTPEWSIGESAWSNVFLLGTKFPLISLINHNDYTEGLRQIAATGLTIDELMEIEIAFERSNWQFKDEWLEPTTLEEGQYIGLVSVLEAMEKMVEEDVPHEENMDRLKSVYEELVESK